MDSVPFQLICQEVKVEFAEERLLETRPECPVRFTWQGKVYEVTEVLAEWQDFQKRGPWAKPTRAGYSSMSSLHGSWGDGRFYYRVRVEDGRIFELYYERLRGAHKQRETHWILQGQRREV